MDIPKKVQEIEWDRWTAVDHATLLFVVRDGQVLLIHKKKGLGAGKINGPGGRLEPGETPLQAAIREVQEELLVTPVGVRACGELLFQFIDGYSIHGYVFRADDCEGVPTETDEAIPVWTPLEAIPYDCMWADDRLWMPLMLNHTPFKGKFIFEDDTMLDHVLEA
ncbi:MAG: 8-oxo-dGTP diphosphatase [Spartobacteria bacterium]|nr:8-oxo-dGTP diphosphatase [Spartobacteria bacterium]